MRRRLLVPLLALAWATSVRAAETAGLADPTPRTAVISAFAPELAALAAATRDKHVYRLAGTTFTTGTLEGKPVVLFLSGVSMVNAAMNTQRALDRFRVSRIVVSGIAGGVDPGLDVGDVVAPDEWGEYLESVAAREDGPAHFAPAAIDQFTGPPFLMFYPKAVEVRGPDGKAEHRAWFPADPALVALAAKVAPDVALKRCTGAGQCLVATPKVMTGGAGVSGQSFVDNAAVRDWAYAAFHARVLDMETAAIAHVAYANGTPFIGFRSLSDLAGGDPGKNQASVFFQLASDNSASVVRAFLRALP